MGRGSLALGALGSTGFLKSCASLGSSRIPTIPFSAKDSLELAAGLSWAPLISWNDPLDDRGLRFGFNNDHLQYFPLGEDDGLLCVNHETAHSGWTADYWDADMRKRSKKQTELEMSNVGVSVVHIARDAEGRWKPRIGSSYNRRIDGRTRIPFSGGTKIMSTDHGLGTLGNCAGGKTPWGTYLTCEENYDNYYGEAVYQGSKRTVTPKIAKESVDWFHHFPNPPEHYGWVVEINPRSGVSKKLIALGRCAHECATVRESTDGRVVVYSGDDMAGGFLYKFIADKKGSLDTGILYVANTLEGRWIPVVHSKNELLKKNFSDQTQTLIRLREAGKLLGATPLDRPEDIDVCPRTGAVYMACTNNYGAGNDHGSILKIMEKGNDPFALEFKAETFLAGGKDTGFSCPDNMVFDRSGSLWITSDMSGPRMHTGTHAVFGNNGLFYIPMSGSHAGRAHLLATAPRDAEFTGPIFSPDGKTLWLSVQHPGELTTDPSKPTSTWPAGSPKPTVVCISGPLLDQLTGIS